MADDLPPRTHNLPPEAVEFEEVQSRADDLVATANRWCTERPTITDEDMAAKCQDFLDQLAAELKAAEEKRTAQKAPHLSAAATVDTLWNPLKARLSKAIELLKPRKKAWLDHVAAEKRRKEDEANRIAEAARIEAERKEREAQEAMKTPGADVVGLAVAADQAFETASALARAATRAAAAPVQVKGHHSVRATGLRTVWHHEVTDWGKLPSEVRGHPRVKTAIDGVIAAMVRGGIREINGVRIWDTQEV